MNREDTRAHLDSTDLIDLGMRADTLRRQLHPDRVVTYCIDAGDADFRVVFHSPEEFIERLNSLRDATAITPVCGSSATAAEYLKLIAFCRLYLPVPHIQLDPEWSGLKVAQLGLRFGADDFGKRKPSSRTSEEEIRRTIRDAGFVPKKRDPLYRSFALY